MLDLIGNHGKRNKRIPGKKKQRILRCHYLIPYSVVELDVAYVTTDDKFSYFALSN